MNTIQSSLKIKKTKKDAIFVQDISEFYSDIQFQSVYANKTNTQIKFTKTLLIFLSQSTLTIISNRKKLLKECTELVLETADKKQINSTQYFLSDGNIQFYLKPRYDKIYATFVMNVSEVIPKSKSLKISKFGIAKSLPIVNNVVPIIRNQAHMSISNSLTIGSSVVGSKVLNTTGSFNLNNVIYSDTTATLNISATNTIISGNLIVNGTINNESSSTDSFSELITKNNIQDISINILDASLNDVITKNNIQDISINILDASLNDVITKNSIQDISINELTTKNSIQDVSINSIITKNNTQDESINSIITKNNIQDISINILDASVNNIISKNNIQDISINELTTKNNIQDVSINELTTKNNIQDVSINELTTKNNIQDVSINILDASLNDVIANNNNYYTKTQTDGLLKWTETNNNIYNNNSGNVGINKTNPSVQLDISGTCKATEFNENGTTLSSTYLRLSGGTMTGPVNMGGSKISNLATPSATTDAATKQYVDSKVSTSFGGLITNTNSFNVLFDVELIIPDGFDVNNYVYNILGNTIIGTCDIIWDSDGQDLEPTIRFNDNPSFILPEPVKIATTILDTRPNQSFVSNPTVGSFILVEPNGTLYKGVLVVNSSTANKRYATFYLETTGNNAFNTTKLRKFSEGFPYNQIELRGRITVNFCYIADV